MEEPSPLSQASLERAGNAPASLSDSENCSSGCYSGGAEWQSAATPDAAALRLLSANLESLLLSPELAFCADARICVASGGFPSPREVAVHRCLLSARSPFFRQLFAGEKENEKFDLGELVAAIDIGYDALVAVLAYIYTGRVGPLPDGVCDCVDEQCPHIACRPAVDFLVQVLYTSFTFQIAELVSLYQVSPPPPSSLLPIVFFFFLFFFRCSFLFFFFFFQRHLLEIVEKVESDGVLVILSAASSCGRVCERLVARCVEVVAGGNLDVVALEKNLPPAIVKQVLESRRSPAPEFPDKHTRRIQRALDSDDVELVRMLLTEGHTTLDDACALHYAVAYCDSKTTMELLDIGVADVNRRNPRGLTVLHVAAMRKEPRIIVSLLTKGASTGDLTRDGRNALQIAKRLTRHAEYYRETEQGMPSPKDKLCIEILEQAERRAPQPGEASVTLAMAGEDARSKLLYMENRGERLPPAPRHPSPLLHDHSSAAMAGRYSAGSI